MYWLNQRRLMAHPHWSDPMYLGPRHSPWTKEGRRAYAQERLAELRREIRAGGVNTQHKELVDQLVYEGSATDHNGPPPGPLTFSVWTHNGRRCVAVCMSSERAQWWLERYPGATVDITPRKGF